MGAASPFETSVNLPVATVPFLAAVFITVELIIAWTFLPSVVI